MFDNKTFDEIMNEMMSNFGADVRTDEGSLAYNACAKQAEQLEEIYGDMDLLSDNLLADTMDLEHLIMYGAERGVNYKFATKPNVRGVFLQEIPLDTEFVLSDYTYKVIDTLSDGEYNYKLECETEGTAANATLGDLEPVDYIEDYQGGQVTEVLVPGVDDEDEEIYRLRVIKSFKMVAFGGNKADYREYIDKIAGVGGCKPMRRQEGETNIIIYIINDSYLVPDAELLAEVQKLVDPETSHGEGDGMAPICHTVAITAVDAVTVNVETTVTLDEGYQLADVEQAISDVISNYLSGLRQMWEDQEKDSTVIRVANIDARILGVTGVIDVANTTINGEASNLTIDYKSIPLKGQVIVNV